MVRKPVGKFVRNDGRAVKLDQRPLDFRHVRTAGSRPDMRGIGNRCGRKLRIGREEFEFQAHGALQLVAKLR